MTVCRTLYRREMQPSHLIHFLKPGGSMRGNCPRTSAAILPSVQAVPAWARDRRGGPNLGEVVADREGHLRID